MHASTNHGMSRPRRIARRCLAAALGLAALLLAAGPASAQSYQITWQYCFDRDGGTDTDIYGMLGFTVLATGERFTVDMRVIHNEKGSSLSFDYYATDSGMVATIDVSAAESIARVTPAGQQVSRDAAIAFVDILRDPAFQAPLQACVAVCEPANQKLFTPMCLLSKTLCCSIVTDTCAACDLADGSSCHDTFHASC